MTDFHIDTRRDIVTGSLSDVAARNGHSLAQSFVNAECVCIVDTSGSMGAHDSRGRRSRYDVACEELAALQGSLPGRIAVLSFANETMFCPDGVPFNQQGGTDLTGALQFARLADVPGIRFIVISDGEPDNQMTALAEAAKYQARIDVIYCGPEEHPAGRDFLTRLAAASGGGLVTADRAAGMADSAKRLLAVKA
jgi:hypothetical protein